ncbi:hypothetical protein R6Q57_005710 [Mikania cordata]
MSTSSLYSLLTMQCIESYPLNLSLNDLGLKGKNEERSAGNSTEYPSSSRKSSFIPKTDFVGRFDEIKIKPNEMFKNFISTFAKNVDVLVSISSSSKQIITEFIQDFWNTITECMDANGTVTLIEKVQGHPVIITKQILKECLQFGDKATDRVELDHDLVHRTVYQMGHEGVYPPTEKKLLHPYWRYLAHAVTQCLSGRKGGYDVLNQTLSSCMVALALGMDFNYSKMIFHDMHANIK